MGNEERTHISIFGKLNILFIEMRYKMSMLMVEYGKFNSEHVAFKDSVGGVESNISFSCGIYTQIENNIRNMNLRVIIKFSGRKCFFSVLEKASGIIFSSIYLIYI